MNPEKYVKKQILYSKIFIIIGVIAAITVFLFGYRKEINGIALGITAGFLPTGIGNLLVYKFARTNPEMQRRLEIESEERNLFINTKAAQTAFWISFWYIGISLLLYSIVKISLLQFLIVTVFFMPIVYFSLLIIYHKKY